MVDLSVVIPVRNEAPAIPELIRELMETLTRWGGAFEIVVIDDGSTDESFDVLARLQAMDPRLRVIRFRRNFGQTAAFAAGFDHARGRYIVTMDGDLQNDPADIPTMVAALDRGSDIVCGWRKERKDPFWSRRAPSRIANAHAAISTAPAPPNKWPVIDFVALIETLYACSPKICLMARVSQRSPISVEVACALM